MGTRNEGVVEITMSMLAELLHLPEGHDVIDVTTTGEQYARGVFSIVVRGPSIPETLCNGTPPPKLRFKVEQKIISGRFVPIAPSDDEAAA